MVCRCCGDPPCQTDGDCEPYIGCTDPGYGSLVVNGQAYCCPEGYAYIGFGGGDCLRVPEGTPGDDDRVPAGDGVEAIVLCCDGICKNTVEDTGACYENPGTEEEICTEQLYDDCQRANQSNQFSLCDACPP
jgi:hypothetical protein